jgi:hypothetical protein
MREDSLFYAFLSPACTVNCSNIRVFILNGTGSVIDLAVLDP